VNETDVFVFAGGHARGHFAAGNFRIDDGLASAPAIIDHHDQILHGDNISENQKIVKD
jgi:hypothetical protein